MSSDGVHAGDNDYTSRTGQKQKEMIPVQGDNDVIEDSIDAQKADSDKQLGMSFYS